MSPLRNDVAEMTAGRCASAQPTVRHQDLALQASGLGTWHFDGATGKLSVCPRFPRVLGYETEVAASWSTLFDLVHPDDKERVLADFDAHLDGLWPFDVACRMSTYHGDMRWFRLTARTELDDAGDIVQVAGTIEDINAQHEAAAREQALQRSLLEASRRAGRADMAVGVLHDLGNGLNNVATSMRCSLELTKRRAITRFDRLIDRLSDPAVLSEMASCPERAQKLSHLLRRSADAALADRASLIAELERGRTIVEGLCVVVTEQRATASDSRCVVERVQVKDLVEDAVREVERTQLTPRAWIRRGDLTTWWDVDRTLAVQILAGFLNHAARQATHNRAVAVVVHTTTAHIRCSVEYPCDTVTEEALAALFQQNHADAATRRLHAVANLAREIGGRVRARWDEARGCVCLTLEVARREASTPLPVAV